jgi:hypothetical protein
MSQKLISLEDRASQTKTKLHLKKGLLMRILVSIVELQVISSKNI